MTLGLERFGLMAGLAAAALTTALLGDATATAAAPACDADGDGHRSLECGGDDCDDGDAARYPGNVEICDARDRDEDCDPSTIGLRDVDGDGLIDSKCCNFGHGGEAKCGTDCNDSNAAILRDTVVCSGNAAMMCLEGVFTSNACFAGTVCIPQPNGTGVCAPPPPGYKAPAEIVPEQRPTNPKPGKSNPPPSNNKPKATKPTKPKKKSKTHSSG